MGEYKQKIDSLAQKIEVATEAVKAQVEVLNRYVSELRDLRDPIEKVEDAARRENS